MDLIALKNKTTEKYSIHQFMKMKDNERQALKGKICCSKCGADAFYRSEGRNGRIACFYSKHIGDCENWKSNRNTNGEADQEKNKIELDISTFTIRWNYDKSNGTGTNSTEGDEEGDAGKNQNKYIKNPPRVKSATISLTQILNYAEAGIIKEQDMLVKFGKKEVQLSDVVIAFNEVNDTHNNRLGFYWGEMKYLKDNFINIKNYEDVSILIDNEILESFNLRYKDKFF